MPIDVGSYATPADREQTTALPIFIALGLAVLLGDWLFWGQTYPGFSLPFYLASLAGIRASLYRTDRDHFLFGAVVLTAGLAPTVETINALTLLIGAGGTFFACMIFRRNLPTTWPARIDALATSVSAAMLRFPLFAIDWLKHAVASGIAKSIQSWIVPLVLAAVFIALFVDANPIWQQWFEKIDLTSVFELILTGRFVFWLALAWFAYPFIERAAPIRLALRSLRGVVRLILPVRANRTTGFETNIVFFERCLILFNLVFAAQSVLDLTYLWAGADLPQGMTYASYAHRGAYPLVVAALLAGIFVLVALRPDGPGERSTVVRSLVLVWVAQNLLLLLSSLLRLELYVEAYALTYWRLAAFIWMTLVAAGLILIIFRFALAKSNTWLLLANGIVLLSTLYATSFVNLPYVISMWNVTHSSYLNEGGARLDLDYLSELGPMALPALNLLLRNVDRLPADDRGYARRTEGNMLADAFHAGWDNWRSWTFRRERLHRYIATSKTPFEPTPTWEQGDVYTR